MDLRCSLTGHDWGEVEIEEERDEGRNEVAITEKEVQRCQNCGEKRVQSQNTKVQVHHSEEEDNEAEENDADGDDADEPQESALGKEVPEDDAVIMKSSSSSESSAQKKARGENQTVEETPGGNLDLEDDTSGSSGGNEDAVVSQDGVTKKTNEHEDTEVFVKQNQDSSTDSRNDTSGDPVYVCPGCEYETPAMGNSSRPGDLCPQCGKSYLEER